MLGWLVAGSMAFAIEPTAEEQQFVWALNRVRHDPAAWAAERGLDARIGGDGQLTTLSDVAPRPPLAVQSLLVGSARGHAGEMAAQDYFGHQSPLDGRWPNDLVRDTGYPLPDSIPAGDGSVWMLDAGANNVESIAAGFADPLSALDALLVDEGVSPPSHRFHLLGSDPFFASHREIGVGVARESSSTYQNYWALHTALSAVEDQFLTGVVYDDRDANGAYDLGEGLGGVEVWIGEQAVVTSEAGGWVAPVVDGDYTVVCVGGDFVGGGFGTVHVAGASREVDFVSGFTGMVLDFGRVEAPVALGCDSAASGAPAAWTLALVPLLLVRIRRARPLAA